MADKDKRNKLHIERISKIQLIKLKKESKRLQTKLRQVKTELEEARDDVVSLVKENSETTIEQYKKRAMFQDFFEQLCRQSL